MPDQVAETATDLAQSLKHPQPLVLLVDMPKEAADRLRQDGFNITTGTFGAPYPVEVSDRWTRISLNAHLPWNVGEQDIVLVDLDQPEDHPMRPPATATVDADAPDWWGHCGTGRIDPRPRAMVQTRDAFDRILEHGGVFVVFADVLRIPRATLGTSSREYGLNQMGSITATNWGFLSELNSVEVNNDDYGEEVRLLPDVAVREDIRRLFQEGHYTCSMEPGYQQQERWGPMATNKFKKTIAAVLGARADGEGFVIILPQLTDKAAAAAWVLNEVLPHHAPHLFPYIEKPTWQDDPSFDSLGAATLRAEVDKTRAEYEVKIAALEAQIAADRAAYKHLREILRETGDDLVAAVRETLRAIGFRQVVDVDEEEGDLVERKREDLQIRDSSPVLLIEVKGITHTPSDTDALRADQYVTPRMREWGRTDVAAVTIINHQRHLPPRDRIRSPFHSDIIDNARARHLGLWTTWDLYRLARSFSENGWTHEQIRHLFYQPGRVDVVPSHYSYVGTIGKYLPEKRVFGLKVEAGEVRIGERLAFDFPMGFQEQSIESLQLEFNPVDVAAAGSFAGIRTEFPADLMRERVRVFRVTTSKGVEQG